jgi:hypothetical protein
VIGAVFERMLGEPLIVRATPEKPAP